MNFQEGKEVKLGGGFSGHGYKFDQAEQEAATNKRRMEKLVRGVEANADDDDEVCQCQTITSSDSHFIDNQFRQLYVSVIQSLTIMSLIFQIECQITSLMKSTKRSYEGQEAKKRAAAGGVGANKVGCD